MPAQRHRQEQEYNKELPADELKSFRSIHVSFPDSHVVLRISAISCSSFELNPQIPHILAAEVSRNKAQNTQKTHPSCWHAL
jgi:hypothetical protein